MAETIQETTENTLLTNRRIPMDFCTESQSYIFACPNCNEFIQVLRSQTACCIFRHGIFKHNGEQVPPHSAKELCDSLKETGRIYGCGKPFKIILTTIPEFPHGYAEMCGYI